MTPEEVDAGLGKIRDWLDDYPEGTVVALFDARAWEVKGYADWDALIAAEIPSRRIQLPRPERREIVGRMADAGMSTRAIATAVGVDHATVARDLAGVANATPRTGLDGKTYPAHVTQTTRTTESTKVEHAVDLATGEILDDLVTSEQWERESRPSVDDVVAADPDVRAAVRRRDFSRWIYAAGELHLFGPAEMADIAPDMAESVERVAAKVATFAAAYRASIVKPTPLHIIKEA